MIDRSRWWFVIDGSRGWFIIDGSRWWFIIDRSRRWLVINNLGWWLMSRTCSSMTAPVSTVVATVSRAVVVTRSVTIVRWMVVCYMSLFNILGSRMVFWLAWLAISRWGRVVFRWLLWQWLVIGWIFRWLLWWWWLFIGWLLWWRPGRRCLF